MKKNVIGGLALSIGVIVCCTMLNGCTCKGETILIGKPGDPPGVYKKSIDKAKTVGSEASERQRSGERAQDN